ncbi:glucose-6-phosphate isomerase [Candidatus Beckwithbacteria bacterium CG23_combo_of_CG06-09_8_20_14_all_34_8]|uniref:Glucose-6-phosphate isomerase n=1 Tax=Candidatus Beckwithbacteria bacterium CG23_combo_of_CG06-09_8_20_14_all_34_8 TaxID=1974497 RepID=A0A2H0B6W6_9BACT|nr:MAG: glucose-6-phosphate isomerase [Candidatus Beckwithbacteria bacterium CG23_combo_of_CG06-09_8_20_14_all_34_8]
MSISLDSSLLFSTKIGSNGIKPQDLTIKKDILAKINENTKKGSYGFVNIVKNEDIIQKCQAIYDQKKWAKYMIVLGIGGSDLGARMLQESLEIENPPMQVLFGGDTTDPWQYYDLTSKIEIEKTVVVVVSKSGSTIEPACGYLYFKNLFRKRLKDDWTKHFIFITDANQGIMFNEGKKNNVAMLPVPDDVGGRYSVLSAVGLLPALSMGIDIVKLVKSADTYFNSILKQTPVENIAWQIALSQYQYQQINNIDIVVLMPYLVRLELFGNWFRQLWAESLGKDGKGILPIKAVGPKDQHSQVQFYNQGKWLSTFLFIGATNYDHDIKLLSKDDKDLQYLDGKYFNDIVRAECLATRVSLAKNGRPSAYIEIDKLNETTMGELIAMFELSVVYLAELLAVNAFDQPGVEAGKNYMYGLLGKKGYEDKAKEIETF